MSKLKWLPLLNLVLILGLSILYIFNSNKSQEQQLAYVDNVVLFKEFNMTRDIMAVEEKKLHSMKNELDSLSQKFSAIEEKQSNEARALHVLIVKKRALFQEAQEAYTNSMNHQVWSRLNTYVKEFGVENNLKIIFGTNGSGTIMFAEDAINVTDKVLNFANRKYEGS